MAYEMRVGKDIRGMWRAFLIAKNGKVIMATTEGYSRKRNALRALSISAEILAYGHIKVH